MILSIENKQKYIEIFSLFYVVGQHTKMQ